MVAKCSCPKNSQHHVKESALRVFRNTQLSISVLYRMNEMPYVHKEKEVISKSVVILITYLKIRVMHMDLKNTVIHTVVSPFST